jgi:hypothetical protein
MGMPGTGRRDQLPGAGARAAVRPNRPSSASTSPAPRPCQRIAACAHAATTASASPSGDPVGPGGQGSRPSGVSMTAARRPNSDGASLSSYPARARRRRSQPRTVAAGTPSCAPGRAAPVPCSADAAAARALAPRAVRAPWHRPRREQDVRRPAGPAPRRRGRSRRVPPGTRMTRSRPQPPGAQPPGPARGAGERAGRQVGGHGVRVAHSSIGAVLPGHGTTVPGRRDAPPGAVRVAGCQAGRRPRHRIGGHRRKRQNEPRTARAMGPWPAPGPAVLAASSHTERDQRRPGTNRNAHGQ